MGLYVDDGLICYTDEGKVEELFTKMSEEFEFTRNDDPKMYIGLELERSENKIKLTQKRYTQNILERFQMENSKPTDTPIAKITELGGKEKDEEVMFPYNQAVGSLLYLTQKTRPGIA